MLTPPQPQKWNQFQIIFKTIIYLRVHNLETFEYSMGIIFMFTYSVWIVGMEKDIGLW